MISCYEAKNLYKQLVNKDHIINKTNQNPLDQTKQKSFNQKHPVTFTVCELCIYFFFLYFS